MPTEDDDDDGGWLRLAEDAYHELKAHEPLRQLEGLNQWSQRDVVRCLDEEDRKAFRDLVWNLLKANAENAVDTVPEPSPTLRWASRIFTPDITAIITWALVAAYYFLWVTFPDPEDPTIETVSMRALPIRIVEALGIGFAVALVLRLMLRSVDRSFAFRRLMISWFVGGAFLFTAPALVVNFALPWIDGSWGGPPSVQVIAAWILGALILAGLALWEAKHASKSPF